LNSYGYFEDLTVQLSGGTNSVKAQYAGDGSFNASSGTTALSITQANTTIFPVNGPGQLTVGTPFSFSTVIESQSSGAAPTGTVSFYANGTKLPGTPQYLSESGSPTGGTASLNANLSVAFSTSGTESITAAYSGDVNYSASPTSAPLLVSVLYPMTLTVSSNLQNVAAGSSVTLTALVDTNVKSPAPTGTISFSGYPVPISGTPTYTTITDASGNSALQATLTITINAAESVSATYSGDANYYGGGSSNSVLIGVPDFSMGPSTNLLTVSQGQSLPLTLYISDLYGFSGTVSNFACSGLPAETTCTFSPTSVTGGGATTLTVSTSALGHLVKGTSAGNRTPWWANQGWAILMGICLIGSSRRKRRRGLTALSICLLLVALPSCGGGSNSMGTTNNPTPAITTLSPSSIAAGSTPPSGLTVNGSGFISSSEVLFNGIGRQTTFMSSSQLSVQLGPSDLAATATIPVVVSNPAPGGGSSNSVNFDVLSGTPTGDFTITVTASGASFTHTTSFLLQVQ
jgi:hypothetical protein